MWKMRASWECQNRRTRRMRSVMGQPRYTSMSTVSERAGTGGGGSRAACRREKGSAKAGGLERQGKLELRVSETCSGILGSTHGCRPHSSCDAPAYRLVRAAGPCLAQLATSCGGQM